MNLTIYERLTRARKKMIREATFGNGFYDFDVYTVKVGNAAAVMSRIESAVINGTADLNDYRDAVSVWLKAIYDETARLFYLKMDTERGQFLELKKREENAALENAVWEKTPTREKEFIAERWENWEYKDTMKKEKLQTWRTKDGHTFDRIKRLYVVMDNDVFGHNLLDLEFDGGTGILKRVDGEELATFTDELPITELFGDVEIAYQVVFGEVNQRLLEAASELTDAFIADNAGQIDYCVQTIVAIEKQKRQFMIQLAKEGDKIDK